MWQASLPLTERPKKKRSLAVERRRRRVFMAGIASVLLCVGVGLLAYASHHPWIAIRHIAVEGTARIDPKRIEADIALQLQAHAQHLFSRSTVFFFGGSTLASNIEQSIPAIKEAQVALVSITDPAIRVRVEERTEYARWCNDGNECFVLDDTGFAFAPYHEQVYTSGVTFRGGFEGSQNPIGMHFVVPAFREIKKILTAFKNETYPIAEFEIVNERDARLVLQNGITIYVTLGQVPEEAASIFKTALTASTLEKRLLDLEYVDLRFGNRVYYKYKREASVPLQD